MLIYQLVIIPTSQLLVQRSLNFCKNFAGFRRGSEKSAKFPTHINTDMGLDNYRDLNFEDTHLERLKAIWNGGREGLTLRDAAIIEASGRTSHNMALLYFCNSAEFRQWFDYCADVEMAVFWGEADRYAWRGAWEVLSRRYGNALDGRVGKGGSGGRGGMGKRVVQYDTDGNLIKVWDSARAIHRELGILPSSVSSCCHGILGTAGGFIFRFEWCQPPEPIENPYTCNRRYKKVAQTDREGNLIAVHGSLREASRVSGVNYANISKCVRGVLKTAGGFVWKEVKDD